MTAPATLAILPVLTALAVAGLAVTAAPAAAQAPPSVPFQVEAVRAEAAGGSRVHCMHYRPLARATGGVLLVHDWLGSGSGCWGDLPGELAAAGCEVLVPDLPGHGLSASSGDLRLPQARPTRVELEALREMGAAWIDLFSTRVSRIVIVGCGWSGLLLPAWLPAEREALALVWIDPRGEAQDWERELREATATPPRLLLVATRENAAGSRVAENLFSHLTPAAELRLFSRGEGGCALARAPGVQGGLREWISALCPGEEGSR